MKIKEMESNDVVVGKQSTMPLAAFIARYDESVSDTELGAKLRESQKRYQEYVEANRPIWKEEGIMFKKVRETMGVTQRELSELIGISPQTLGRLEKGEPVRSRKMMIESSRTALNLVDLQRKEAVNRLETETKA